MPFYFLHHLCIHHEFIESIELIFLVIQFLVSNNAIDADCFSSSITVAERSYKHTETEETYKHLLRLN